MSKLDQIAALHRAMLNGGMGFDELEEYGRVSRLFRIEGLTRPQIEAACKDVEPEPITEPVAVKAKRRG